MIDRYLHQPREVSIETLALCNAACEFCPYETLERKGARMDDATILHLISQMKDWQEPFFISPFKVNEPFLDKRLLTICRWINEDLPRARLRIFTNGSRFTHDNVQELLALKNIEHIWISLNEVDADRYKQVMNYVTFEHVAAKIDILHEAHAAGVGKRVVVSRVSSSMAERTDEIGSRNKFDAFVRQRWPNFVPFHIKRDGWIGYTEPSSDAIPNTPCARWWELNITATGECALCCMDGTAEYSVGNIHKQRLTEIYNQPQLLAKRLGTVTRMNQEPCKRCTY